jgi:hypothetical protein
MVAAAGSTVIEVNKCWLGYFSYRSSDVLSDFALELSSYCGWPEVIGDFRFLEQPCECDVTLELSLSPSGERLGTLRFGCDVQAKLDEIGFAARQETLPLASALPYAIAVAMQSETPLVLTGDPTVWNPHWGMLRATSSVKSPA